MGDPELQLSDHDTDVEELLSQFDEENLLELNLNSFRYESGELSFEDKLDHSETAEILAAQLSATYEKVYSHLPRDGELVQNESCSLHVLEAAMDPVLHERKDEEKMNDDRDALNQELADQQQQARVEPLSICAPGSLITYPASTTATRNPKVPAPPIASSKSLCAACFCMSPMKMLKRSFRRPSPNSNGNLSELTPPSKGIPSTPVNTLRIDEEETRQHTQGETDMDFEKGLESDRIGQNQGWERVSQICRRTLLDPSTFSMKEREKEFRRVSKKERQLTEEANKLVEWVSSASARLDLQVNVKDGGGEVVDRR